MIDHRTFSSLKLENNPVLLQELNGVSLSQKRCDIRRSFWIVTGIVVLGSVAICYLPAIFDCHPVDLMSSATCRPLDFTNIALRKSIFPLIAYGSFLVGLLFDLYFVSLAGGRIIREKEGGHWDLMRTTTLSPIDIIVAKYTSAKLRAWRVLTIEVALRIAAFSIYEISDIVAQTNPPFTRGSYSFFGVLTLLIVIGICILEPIWRMQLVVSMGFANSVRGRNFVSVTLTNFGALLAMRILQGILIAACLFPLGALVNWLYSINIGQDELDLLSIVSIIFFCLFVYLFYYLGYHWILRSTLRFVSPPIPES